MRILSVLNIVLLIGLVVFAVVLYAREQQTRLAEREIRRLEADIAREEENIRILQVERAMLVNPERIERLVRRHLVMAPVGPDRIRGLDAILADLPTRAFRPDAQEGVSDPLAALIAQVQQGEKGQ